MDTCSARCFPMVGSSTIVRPFDSSTAPRWPTISISRAFTSRVKFRICDSGPARINYDERLGEQAGFELRAQVVAPSYHALPALIVGTDRIATIQMRLAEKLAASYPIRIVPLPLPLPVLEEAMMWHPRLDRDAGHAWLRGLLRETAAALPAMGRAPQGAVQHRPRRHQASR